MGLPRVVFLHGGLEWPYSVAVPLCRLLDINRDVKRVSWRAGSADIILHSCDHCSQQVRLRPALAPLRLRHGTINTLRSPDAVHDICLRLLERGHD